MIYLLHKQKRQGAFGFGGSLMVLGIILLAIGYGLVSGILIWILTGADLVVFASFFYIAARKGVPESATS